MSTPDVDPAKKDRSPSYPFISLKTAVERLVQLEDYFKRHPTPADKVGLAWDLKETSSQAAQTLGALKAFGLIAYEGSGPKRLVKITEAARNYLRAQQDSIRIELLKRFALTPKSMAHYWQDWKADRPIDAVCLDKLVIDDKYTPSAATTFLRVYDETVRYAGLADETPGPGSDNAPEDLSLDKPAEIAVGSFVQWESGGQLQFSEPRRVRALSADLQWIFVDGSESGIPVSQVTVERSAPAASHVPDPVRSRMPPQMPEPIRTEDPKSGEREWLRGPLSKGASYRLFVSGDVGPREIGKLIKLLEAQKLVLDDDDGLDDL